MFKKVIVIGIIFTLIIVGLSGCNENDNSKNSVDIEISNVKGEFHYIEPSDIYGYYVRFGIYNSGIAGDATIHIKVTQATGIKSGFSWGKQHTDYFEAGEGKTIRAIFYDLDRGETYVPEVWIEYKY